MATNKTDPGANYLNVDLEIRSRFDLKTLAEAVSPGLDVIHFSRISNEFLLSLEVPGCPRNPDATIMILAKRLLALPPSVRKQWKQVRDRVFDVGIEKTVNDGVFVLALRLETVKTVAKLDARVAITLYPLAGRLRMPNKPLKLSVGRRRPPSA